jgi:hypothetical protein
MRKNFCVSCAFLRQSQNLPDHHGKIWNGNYLYRSERVSAPTRRHILLISAGLAIFLLVGWTAQRPVIAQEPAKINPFGAPQQNRDDAVFGYLELSDATVFPGKIYLTRDKRLKIYDDQLKRQREVPLRAIRKIECAVKKEWMEKEWRFKESALNQKVYTGRSYPAREYVHTITLDDGRTIAGPLAEIVYVEPIADSPGQAQPHGSPKRFLLNKRGKGEVGDDLKSLTYVRVIKLGDEALEEGKRKAALHPSPPQPEVTTSR